MHALKFDPKWLSPCACSVQIGSWTTLGGDLRYAANLIEIGTRIKQKATSSAHHFVRVVFSEGKYTYVFLVAAEGDLRYTNISRRSFALKGFSGPTESRISEILAPRFAISSDR